MKSTTPIRYIPWGLMAILLIYFAFSISNPFAATSIISNLEPYPDPFYYAQPAWNFVHGSGFTMDYLTHKVQTIVPPLYTFYLIPFFALFGDVRSFFIANQILMTASVVLFFIACTNVWGKRREGTTISILLGVLLVTNFYVFTAPLLLMAETPTFFLVTVALHLLTAKLSPSYVVIASFLGAAFWLTKFSNAPVGAMFYLLYSYKVLRAKSQGSLKRNYFVGLLSALLVYWLYVMAPTRETSQTSVRTAGFAIKYFFQNLPFYLTSLLGGSTRYLWFGERLVSPLIAVGALSGIIFGLRNKENRELCLFLLILVGSVIGFMSFFYSTDGRYAMHLYPLLLMFIGFTLHKILKKEKQWSYFLIVVFFVAYLLVPHLGQRGAQPQALTLAREAAAHIRGTQKPWYYIATMEFNSFFSNPGYEGSYMGTFLPPYFVEYYTNHQYHYLPLSKSQDFFTEKGKLSTAMGIDSIEAYYTRLLKQGKRIFVSNAFAGNKKEWGDEFESLKTKFNARLVKEGCLGTCNIYQLTLD